MIALTALIASIISNQCACFLISKESHSTSPLFSSSKTLIAENRKANFEYEWEEKYEAGIQLTGTEVKSCRRGTVQISDGIAEIRDGECWILNVHIGI